MRVARIAMLAAAGGLLSSCVALAVPVVAGAAIGGKQVAGRSGDDGRTLTRRERKAERKRLEAQARNTPVPQGSFTILPQGSTLPAPGAPVVVQAVPGSAAPAGMQYLYGSGEAAALDVQGYRALRNHLSAEARLRDLKIEPNSVVLAEGATLAAPRFVPCGTKKLAMVLDIDETVLLNLGYEADEAGRGGGYDEARWRRWELTGAGQVRAVPGAKQAIDAARAAGIAVVFNSNRSEASAAATADALKRAGLGEAVPGETLWLRTDGQGSGKDARRWRIAERYCVVALVGDQLGDFSDLFNTGALAASPAARRSAALADPIADEWGAGWFMLPNPVYGTALKGSVDEVFPPAVRWSPNP
ncbi:5'-nucleotidase (lipoprotein e(P4) family) [Sphingomonas jinjuensis]|uniref:5'-nucleotidase (Lipoprotein e(P4) family) n=1 Tax=Sphingomonas jinjuensis TaxID=535907 RepID=A0A840F6C5_9SPHN|nr:HAD family acid phosphatase [Sphingomonas jinjuensis]MBB4153309.1 5'-nucleotidase (lipoprotein e(P4) family) [Sphingomonas jinjuensis]